MPDEVIETRDERLDRIETDLRNIHGLGLPRMGAPLEAFFDQPDMPEQIAASGRPALIAKACEALADMAETARDGPELEGYQNKLARVLSPEGCATISRSVDLASTRLVLESTHVLPSDIRLGLLPQLVTREACATAADQDDAEMVGSMAAWLALLPREIQQERMPLLLTRHATETMGMGRGARHKSAWAAARGADVLPPETRAEAIANILSPQNCGGLAQCDDARFITESLVRLAVLPQPLRGERQRMMLTAQAQTTMVESRHLPCLVRALQVAKTWPREYRTPALTNLLWPGGTPQTCELFAQSPEPIPLAHAVRAAMILPNPLMGRVLNHLLTRQAFRMTAENGSFEEVGIAAAAIPFLPPARRAPAARALLTERALAALERGVDDPLAGVCRAAEGVGAASFLTPAEQAEVARRLMTQTARDSYLRLTDEGLREYGRKRFETAIASLPKDEQARWRAVLAPPLAEWQKVMAERPSEQPAGAGAAGRRADAASPGGP